MKLPLLASLLLLAAPLRAHQTPTPSPAPTTKDPIAVSATRGGKASTPAASSAHAHFTVTPPASTAAEKSAPVTVKPVKVARPGYLFM